VPSFTKGVIGDNIGKLDVILAMAYREFGMGIRRAKKDRWIYGVCGGLSHRYGWSSTAVRAVVVLLAIFIPGISVIPAVLIYVLLGYLLPEAEDF
jgi:phage shock protein C